MNLIDHLTRTVSPILFGNHPDTTGNYTALLEKVYAIFITRLADKETYQNIGDTTIDSEDSSFFERLIPAGNKDEMIQELSKQYNIEEQDVQTLVTRSAPLVVNELRGLAGTSSLPDFLTTNLHSVASFLPTWATALIPASILSGLNLGNLGQAGVEMVHNAVDSVSSGVSNAVNSVSDGVNNAVNQAQQAVSSATNTEAGGLGKVLLPLIALLIIGALIAMMLKSCNKAQTTTAPSLPVASVASATGAGANLLAPTLKFTTGADGKLLDGGLGVVGNDELKGKILGALSGVFGEGADKAVNVNVNPAHDVNLPFADKLADIFNLLKGVPNATLNYVDNHIMVSAPDETLAKKLVADIQALVPNTHVMLEGEHNHHGHGHGHEHHDHAHQNQSANASVEFTNGRLNFYFATGKADVAQNALEHAKAILDEAKAGKKLGISGYTDSTGNAAANAKLSKKRAESVKKFLMENGVAENQIELIKPKDTVGASGKDQEGRRVEVYVVEETTPASTAN